MNRTTITVIILIGIVIIGWQMYAGISPSTKESPRERGVSVAVDITPISTTVIREVGVFTGTLLPESQFIIAPKITGRLAKMFVDIGDNIKQGQLIALLDDDEFVQQVDQAKAELDVARANIEENRSALNLAEREFERSKALREKKIVSESELDASEAHYMAMLAKQKVAQAQVAQKEAELKSAQVRLGYTRITASWEKGNSSRFVGERFVDEGAMLAANTPIASIIDISHLRAVIHVIERDYPRVATGQQAVVSTDAYPDRTFSGIIARIAPLLKEASRQARVEIDIPNPENLLKPGMFVRVEIEFARHADATVVPFNALTRHNGQWGIFVADTETMRAKLVPVKVGIVSGDMVEILEPAVSGLVVTIGQHLLEDNAAIILPEEKKEDTPEQNNNLQQE